MREPKRTIEAIPINLADFERRAQAIAEPQAWDFIRGGSEDEATLAMNRSAYGRWALVPRVLVGGDTPDLSLKLCGTELSSPILVAPVGYQALVHESAESATAKGAGMAGMLMVASTMSNQPMEVIANAATGPLWFQLYVMKDHDLTLSLMRRAEDAGYGAVVVTVDVPRMGRRERDARNQFALPTHLRPGNLPSAADPDLYRREQGISSIATHANEAFDTNLDWEKIERLREQTQLPFLLKGILSPQDAVQALEIGVDGIIVSNHGGRQLDGALSTLDALPGIVAAVDGRCQLILDGGIRRGTDAIKARALGADAVMIGRPAIWGLINGGADGVRDVLQLLHSEIDNAMALSGQRSWSTIDSSLLQETTLHLSPRAG